MPTNTYETALRLPVLLERVWDNTTPGTHSSPTYHIDRLTLTSQQAANGPYGDINKKYGAGTNPLQIAESQRFGCQVEAGYQISGTVPSSDETRWGALAIEWELALQQSDGSFKDCDDSEHSTGLFLLRFGEAVIAAQDAGDSRTARWRTAYLAALSWYFLPANLARIETGKTHRLMYTAQIALMGERLQPGAGWQAKALPYLRQGIAAQDASGYFPETSTVQGKQPVMGYDVSYNCISLSSLARDYLMLCDLGCTDPSVSQAREALKAGLVWQRNRQNADNTWNLAGSVRVGPGGEVDRFGNLKHMDNREATFALLLGACATGRQADYDAGIRSMRVPKSADGNGQSWLTPSDSYAFSFASPDPPGGTTVGVGSGGATTTGACGMTAAITASGAVDNEDGTFSVSFTCAPTGGTSPYSYLWAFDLPAGLDGTTITPLLPVGETYQTVDCNNIPFAPYQAAGLAQRVGVPAPVWLVPSCTVTDAG